LAKNNLLTETTIFELNDIHGPTLDEKSLIEAIIITEKTSYGAELINKLRKEKGLPLLVIIETAMVKAVDGGELSSSRIRKGEIDREGELFIQPLWLEKDLRLPEDLRLSLQKPLGVLIPGHEDNLNEAIEAIKLDWAPRMVARQRPRLLRGGTVTVGDVVTKSFNESGMPIDIAIVDFWVKRQEKFTSIKELGFVKAEADVVIKNPKGTLTADLFQAVQEAIKHLGGGRMDSPEVKERGSYIIRVIGEEDLATLAAVCAAPLGTRVFYGQPAEGIVDVLVTEEKKAEAKEIISRFVASELHDV